MNAITAKQLKPLLTDGEEIAFLDIREHGQYGEGHPFFSVHVPYSQIEHLAPRLMPCLAVRCVLMDDGDGVAERAANVLVSLGYKDVSILDGGAPAWAAAGYTHFKGVNVPSKTFGELVEHHFDTQSISAEELNQKFEQNEDMIVLDGRTPREYNKMTIPNSQSCPNAELGYRIPMLCTDPKTTVVVNCAGRTRSIIGAEILNMLDIPNPIYALRNGTQGWRLSGFNLVHGAEPGTLPIPDSETWEAGRAKAANLREDYGIPTVSAEDVKAWRTEPDRSTYLFDVRSAEEYAVGHAAGAHSAPGGQLIQATDEQLAVRNARIILTCDNGLRATTTAILLAGMGHQVWVLNTDTPRDETKSTNDKPEPNVDTIDLATLKSRVDAGATIIDVSNGMDYRAGHIQGAIWATRARLDQLAIDDPTDVVLVGQSAMLILGIINEFKSLTGKTPRDIIVSDPDAWRSVGINVVETSNAPSEEECIDYLFFVHDRHDGNLDAARRYLEWETGLLDQLDDQEKGALKPLDAAAG
ncbi:rhodanese-like domain-containing protein [Rhodospirillales bacterium]|nr:rhodanese-like domain-containing protein [Rhodospirillales bacterium]